MSKNIQILSAQSDIHNMQCLISLLRKMLQAPDVTVTWNEYELEGMCDQLDEMFDRLERLNAKLDALKRDNPAFDTLQDGKNVVAILAKYRGTHSKIRSSKYSRNGNGNGNGNKKLQEIPNITA